MDHDTVGIKERRILKGEGIGTSYMGIRAVKQLLEKTNVNPEEIEVILTATTTPDHHFPTTSSIIAYHTGCKNAMTFDLQGACAGFCMHWKRVQTIFVRDATRKLLWWPVIR